MVTQVPDPFSISYCPLDVGISYPDVPSISGCHLFSYCNLTATRKGVDHNHCDTATINNLCRQIFNTTEFLCGTALFRRVRHGISGFCQYLSDIPALHKLNIIKHKHSAANDNVVPRAPIPADQILDADEFELTKALAQLFGARRTARVRAAIGQIRSELAVRRARS